MTSVAAPPLKRGWLRKQARSGLVKNWQVRYFVLNQGKLSYYQEQLDRFPYGDILKGELELFDATISKDIKKFSDKQIYVISRKGQKDILMESDTEKDAREWSEAVKAHIEYANSTFTGDHAPGAASERGSKLDRSSTSMLDDRASSLPSYPSLARKDSTGVGRDSEDGNDAPSTSTFVITPKPAWVVKVLRTNGEKIFVNLCEHSDIPMMQLALNLGFNKWPFMILTPARAIHEDKEDGNVEVSIYDAVVNPAVVNICAKDPQAKDATCLRIMRLLKKKFGEDLQLEYKLPKINKKYKGDIQQVLVPSNISSLAKSRSSVHVQVASPSSIATAVSQPSVDSSNGEAETTALKATAREPQFSLQRKMTEPVAASTSPKPGLVRRSTMTKLFPNMEGDTLGSPNSPPPTLQRTYTEVPYNTVSSVRAGAQRRSMRTSFVNPVVDKTAFKASGDGRKVVVPYIIVRSNGITAKSRPDKSSTGKILGHGVKVFVVARKVMPDHIAWLRTTEGWIMEKVFAGTIHRVATPCLYGQPTAAKIINTRFEEHGTGVGLRSSYGGDNTSRVSNGWFSFRASALEEMFQTRFNIEIMHQDNAILRISRTFSEILTLRAMLLAFNDKALKDRTLKAGEFPIMHDGENDLLSDVHLLIEVVESVELWFNKLFSTVQVERCKCKSLKEFLTPKESDYHLMEVELMAEGGICGGWSSEIEEDLASMLPTE